MTSLDTLIERLQQLKAEQPSAATAPLVIKTEGYVASHHYYDILLRDLGRVAYEGGVVVLRWRQ